MTLVNAALEALGTSDARAKAMRSRELATEWFSGRIAEIGSAPIPERPARPEAPILMPPADVPKRKITRGLPGRIALLHALSHIELNAIDLAWDIAARFTHEKLPREFYDDWVKVADDEARHFLMLDDILREMGSHYGALPAHDGLWEAAMKTADDLFGRLAIVPLVLEARGLDVTPAMIEKLKKAEDETSAAALQVIHDDEITHVAAGKRWFEYLCQRDGLPEIETWQNLVQTLFRGILKRPFNVVSRERAGFSAAFYDPIAS
ncbi:ferritin-like domain-containing protein [Aestuariispira insulae]|uniref:Uncharacterized ferritin-like protein (DUF455 family) n=1 Tax=Aestuariispira insulae TaxID=1461337 RepID=A0A3D9HVW3_9PROT|nr:ferritin-like domain-containing protein [Aestuariispira insulae]RED53653.1 uncharacterized ferritin-like protein (DUF455 family) [Aestuariispira insulae]